ncbi:dipeptidase [Effusibacillus dendaii]|uniref:Peptidase n=1 Tax=Effusibacillus dendaii TaxID=2743772 RepID=A0A7I8DCV8_9BACL|nr:dipeptidase [Effusibacillus dendaii]BCJ85741.1 peptidase [Effusibacillus dendaii]
MENRRFIMDAHADILYRMETEHLSFFDPDSPLQLSYSKIKKAGIDLQVFALFVDPPVTPEQHLMKLIAYIETFRSEICKDGRMNPVITYQEIEQNFLSHRKSALLSIEGGDFLNGDLRHLRILYLLGVRAMGLTWNNKNAIASGVGEPTDEGLTPFGRQVVEEMNRLGMVVDVSHLAPKGIEDVLQVSKLPIIASHSNAKSVYPHRRNLTDEQIASIAKQGGVIGATFVPDFIAAKAATIDDLLRHIDRLLTVGGEDHVGLGSDFDGIEETMVDLRSGADYPKLIEALDKQYGSTVTDKICGQNFLRVLKQVLK